MLRKVVEFGPDQGSAIKRLAERFHRSESDIVRAGVALFQIATREASKGRAIGVVSDGRVVSELCGVWSEAVNETERVMA